MREIEFTLKDRLLSIVQSMGYELWGIELKRYGRSSLLRIFIDSENGITVDDCADVSRQVSAMLDVEDPIQGQYTLEVSSPGTDRLLFDQPQYVQYVGAWLKVRTFTPIDTRRNFVGQLHSVNEENITLLVDDQEVVVPFSNIEKAKVSDKQ